MTPAGFLAGLMLPETHHDEHLHFLEENRYLRATIAEMRAALEQVHQEKREALQNATQETAHEMTHMRNMISALREQLENLEQEKNRAVQQAAADTFNGMREYIAIIKTEREEMERLVEAHAAQIQQLRRDARDEHAVLEQTIAALREQLENSS